ncbi:hypothetical protein MOC30_14570 [Bacillus spizizenii]|nr:hypothetical protein [Bacillus spizizenii]
MNKDAGLKFSRSGSSGRLNGQIFEIEDKKLLGELTVKRVNSSDLEVVKNNISVFKGEDFEVADFINSELEK